jgi:hypothetical protein
LDNSNVYPEASGDLISYLEMMLNTGLNPKVKKNYMKRLLFKESKVKNTENQVNEEDYERVNVSKDQLSHLKTTLEKIEGEKWKEVGNHEIIKSQKILYKMLRLIKNKIEE